MKTPICDFLHSYASSDSVRMHMPGHKGVGDHGESFDITEIDGADSLFEASGIIKESEVNASQIFGADTFYSTEGSSLCIRAMVYLVSLYARERGKRPLIAAGRNVHRSFVSAAAMSDADVDFIFGNSPSYLSCRLSGSDIEAYLKGSSNKPDAIYITSPDYLGAESDIKSVSKVCKREGILLLVDNAHGAYLKFLSYSRHPIDLGADMCCDSAHKTLSAITGCAYLHVARTAPIFFAKNAKDALALFGSTSPSYLMLASLDRLNPSLANGYSKALYQVIDTIETFKDKLKEIGYTVFDGEPMKITIDAKKYGYTGYEISEILSANAISVEFADPDFTVLMPSTESTDRDFDRLLTVFKSIPKKTAINTLPPKVTHPIRKTSVRAAVFSPSETVSVKDAIGRTLSDVTLSCPPAVPILVSGEVIDESAVAAFEYYGINECKVLI